MKRLSIIDPDDTFSAHVRAAFESEHFSVERFKDGTSGLAAAMSRSFHLILLEAALPGVPGIEVCREVRRRHRAGRTGLIIVTAHGHEDDRVAGLDAGADDYVVKPVSTRELLARSAAILRRASPDAPDDVIYHDENLTLFGEGMRAIIDGQPVDLSRGESAVITVLLHHAPSAISSKQIRQELSADRDVTQSTIDARIKSLRRKIGRNRIETRTGFGYAFRTSTES